MSSSKSVFRSATVSACFLSTYILLSANAYAEFENNLDVNASAEAGYIDNFLYQTDNEQSTAFYKLSSTLALESKNDQSSFNIDAMLDSYQFSSFKDDNHTDFSFIPKYQFKFSQNQRLYVAAYWLNSYMYRGTGLSLGTSDTLLEGDERQNVGGKVGFEYGTFDSQARLNIEVNYNEGEFTTRRSELNIIDNEMLEIHSGFDYLLSGKTYIAFDVAYRMIEYPNDPQRNVDSMSGLVGIKWQTTVISELSFLVGYQNFKFEQGSLKDNDAFKWQFDYIWRPSDFTTLHLESNRKFEGSNRLNNSYRLIEKYQVDISHELTDNINISAAIGFNTEEFISSENTEAEDYLIATLGVNYQRSDRLSFYLRYQYNSLNANYADIDYLHNEISLGVNVDL